MTGWGDESAGEVLESLIIEVIGDDSNLRSILDDAVATASRAADAIRSSLNIDLGNVAQSAQQVTAAVEATASAVQPVATNSAAASRSLEELLLHAWNTNEEIRRTGYISREQYQELVRQANAAASATQSVGRATEDMSEEARRAAQVQAEAAEAARVAAAEQEELRDVITRISNEVRASRNVWAGRITSDEEFRASTIKSRDELLKLMSTVERGSTEYRKLSQELAYAQRGLDSVNKVASRGGLAWTAQIALANQFGQALRGLGPAGNAAAGALGLMQGGLGALSEPLKLTEINFARAAASASRFALVIAPLAATVGGVAATGALVKLTTDAAKLAGELEAMTFRTGLNVESLQELRYAAQQTNVPVDLLATTMQRLQRRAADANAGNKGLKEAFDALGVSLTDADGRMRGTESLLEQVADGLSNVSNEADRLRMAFKIFDTEGGRLLPLLTRGSEGIRELRQQARDLGLVVSGDTVMSLSQLGSELDTVRQQGQVLRMELAGAFLPVLRDGILPLVRDQLVPWLGNVALRVMDFSEALFDASPAGTAFRAEVMQSLAVVVSFGRGIYAAGQAISGFVQGILSGVANLGAFLGTAFADVNFAEIEQSFRDAAATAEAARAALDPDDFPDYAAYLQKMQDYGEEIERLNLAAAEASGGRIGQAMRAVMENEMGRRLGEGAQQSFEGMWSALTTDMTGWLEEWVQDVASAASPGMKRTLTELTDEVAGALQDPFKGITAPEGSIQHAEQTARAWATAFGLAVTDESREHADEMMRQWNARVEALRLPFADQPDVTGLDTSWYDALINSFTNDTLKLADANARLSGTTIATRDAYREAVEVFEIALAQAEEGSDAWYALSSVLVTSRARLAEINEELGSLDVTALVDGAARIGRALLTGVGDAATTAVENARGALATLADPLADVRAALTIEGRTATLLGRDFDATATEIELLERRIRALAADYDDLNLVQRYVLNAMSARHAELVASLDTLDVSAVVDSVTRIGRAIASNLGDAATSAIGSVRDAFASLTDPLAEVREAVEARGRTATLLGVDFDATAAEVSVLESRINDLSGRYSELSLVERFVLNAMSARLAVLRQLNAETAAQDASIAAARASAEAYREWADSVRAVGAEADPLASQERALIRLLEQGVISVREYARGRALLADQADVLAAQAAQAAYSDLLGTFEQLGVTTDPYVTALNELVDLYMAGSITAEEYAAAIEAAGQAQARLNEAARDAEREQAQAGWDAASEAISGFTRVARGDFASLADAATRAFRAGIIGAEELQAALNALDVMRLAEDFRIVANSLSDTQAIIPNLTGDLVQAFAALDAGNTTDALTMGFGAATRAIESLSGAFEDTSRQGEAMFDLLVGGAAAIGTAIGGPALGQAIGAIGGFVKSILGDLGNGLAEIERQINATASSSRLLSDNLIRGLAEGATRRVSRGGLLGLIGLTKNELDQEAFQAGVSTAESIAAGLVNTLRAQDFDEAWEDMLANFIVEGAIQRLLAQPEIEAAIAAATEAVLAGRSRQAAGALDVVRAQFEQLWGFVQDALGNLRDDFLDVSSDLASALTSAMNNSTWQDAWADAARGMKNVLRNNIIQAFIEGEAMQGIFERFNVALNAALADGIISDAEMRTLEAIFAATEGPTKQLFDALDALGLSFDDLNDTVQSVTGAMRNVPSVWLDTTAMFESVASADASAARFGVATPDPRELGDVATEYHITFAGDVYGFDEFGKRVQEAVAEAEHRRSLARYGVSR